MSDGPRCPADADPEVATPDAANDDLTLAGRRQSVTLSTPRGEIRCRLHAARDTAPGRRSGPACGLVLVGGVGGGWDSPARGLFDRLSTELAGEDIAVLRVRYRDPNDLDACVYDTLAGLHFLVTRGIGRFGLIGHSLGGAVAIRAAAAVPTVAAVATLATQGVGTEPAAKLTPRAALLLLHGTGDASIPAAASRQVHALAGEPKRLVLFQGAGHGLDEVADRVHRELRDWFLRHLRGVGPAASVQPL